MFTVAVKDVDIEGRCSEGGRLTVGSVMSTQEPVSHLDSQPLVIVQVQVGSRETECKDNTYRLEAAGVLVHEEIGRASCRERVFNWV